MPIQSTDREGVYTDHAWLYTRNLVPGVSVYGESLHVVGRAEYRRWDAKRSKACAYLKKGGAVWPFRRDSAILYLGAASGTTVSHLSDICPQGVIAAVEIAPRPFRNLISLSEKRPNVVPVLADASRPDVYRARVEPADVLYQDIAQRGQKRIFLRNVEFLRPKGVGFLMLKARSEDVSAEPPELYRAAAKGLEAEGFDLLDLRPLDPLAKAHAAIVVRAP